MTTSDNPEPPAPSSSAADARAVARWEFLGLAAVLLGGAAVLFVLLGLVVGKKDSLDAEKVKREQERKKPATPVVVTMIDPVTVVDRIRLPGMVQAWIEVDVSAEVAGQVVHTKTTPLADGATIRKGQALLHLDPEDCRIAFKRAQAGLKLAQETYRRTRKLVGQGVKTPSDMDRDTNALDQAEAQVAAARLSLARCAITSPIDGVVDDVLPEVGEYVVPGQKVARVLDLRRVKIEVGIPERDVTPVRALVDKQANVRVEVEAVRPGYTVEGRCIYLSREPRQEALVYTLRLAVENPDGVLRPGMFVKADVVKARHPKGVKIPLYAVLPKGERHHVFVAEPKRDATPTDAKASTEVAYVARRREVTLGVMQGRDVEIVAGLHLGERLIIRGQRSVADGAPIRIMRSEEDAAEMLR